MASKVSPYAVRKYRPNEKRSGIALALSGGGYRAALFHLGALRRLNELGVLQKVTAFSSVSGGSVISAFLATRLQWPLAGRIPDEVWEINIGGPMRDLARRNVRSIPFIKTWLLDWFKAGTGITGLAANFEQHISRKRVCDLPDRPKFIFCATDMSCGTNWTFTKETMGNDQVGYTKTPDWSVATLVAASACFPLFLGPMPVRVPVKDFSSGELDLQTKARALSKMRLVDGGNYDNLALEALWKDFEIVLASDGGDTFDIEPDGSLLHRVIRHILILYNQSIDLRKRWLISNYLQGIMRGAYWAVGNAASSFDPGFSQGYPKELASDYISQVRTEFDVFSEAEIKILEAHGYVVADAAIRTHQPELIAQPMPALDIPHAYEWGDPKKAMDALQGSKRYHLPLGRLF